MDKDEEILTIALPKRGRIADGLGDVFLQAGYNWSIPEGSRTLFAKLSPNIEVMFVRTQDIPTVVGDGIVDIGITGTDLVQENQCKVNVLEYLDIFSCKLVLAGPSEWKKRFTNNPDEEIKIATSFPNITKAWAKNAGITVQIVELSGSVEIAPKMGIADAIIDLTQSGSTLKSNGLDEVETISDVKACVIAAEDFSLDDDSTKAYQAQMFIQSIVSVLAAKNMRYLMMNVPKTVLQDVRDLVPGLSSPTTIDLYGDDNLVAIHVVIRKEDVNEAIIKLKQLGAKGILVSNIERLIP